jgi:biotin carboxyl carrier protein
VASGWRLIEDGDTRWRVAVADSPEGTWVFVDGQVALIPAATAPASRGRSKSRGEAGVMSPMPATVVAIKTAIGETVKEGDTVIVLEAMKMELPIKAPRSGVVKAIHCAKGELVQPGISLLEIAAAEGTDNADAAAVTRHHR